MRMQPVMTSKMKSDVVEITRTSSSKIQMLTESKEASNKFNSARRVEKNLVESYIRELLIKDSLEDIPFLESVNEIVKNTLPLVDVRQTILESEMNLSYIANLVESPELDIEDNDSAHAHLKCKVRELHSDVDDFLAVDIEKGFEESTGNSEDLSLVYARFYGLKVNSLTEGEGDISERGEAVSKKLLERSMKEVKTLLLIENSGIIFKEGARVKDIDSKFISPLLGLVGGVVECE